jgi:hypothetical protein
VLGAASGRSGCQLVIFLAVERILGRWGRSFVSSSKPCCVDINRSASLKKFEVLLLRLNCCVSSESLAGGDREGMDRRLKL